jgi:hypothetical protein
MKSNISRIAFTVKCISYLEALKKMNLHFWLLLPMSQLLHTIAEKELKL